MCAFFTYMAILVSFVAFRAWFPTITREFKSPLGYAGAFYGMAVFSLAIVGVCGFQKDQVALYTFLGLVVIASVYYFWVVEKRQVFSEEEKTVMFKAYVLLFMR
jgi:L-asparagine transporter-like permease